MDNVVPNIFEDVEPDIFEIEDKDLFAFCPGCGWPFDDCDCLSE